MHNNTPRLHLGLAMWANPDWKGSVYTPHTAMTESLPDYASAFDAVEGNTTFYSGIPKEESVRSWADQTPPTFRFCFKLPAFITHEKRLRDCEADITQFLQRLAPLGPRIGPVMVQLPRDLGQEALIDLERLLAQWPAHIPCAVEPRSFDFFAKGEAERALNRLLITYNADRIMLDVRPVMTASNSPNPALLKAQQEKPKRPLHVITTGSKPIVRFIGHFDDEINDRLFAPWIDRLALWITQGKTPFLFVHIPDNKQAPMLARRYAERVSETLQHNGRVKVPKAFAGERQSTLF